MECHCLPGRRRNGRSARVRAAHEIEALSAGSIRDLLLVGFENVVEVRARSGTACRWSRAISGVMSANSLFQSALSSLLWTFLASMPGYQLNFFTMPSACTSGLVASAMNSAASFSCAVLVGNGVIHRLTGHAGRDELERHVRRQLAVGLPGIEHVDPDRAHGDLAAVEHVERAGIAGGDHDVLVEVLEVGHGLVPAGLGGGVVGALSRASSASPPKAETQPVTKATPDMPPLMPL